ncbi:MAG: 2-C-methyl-D-erythritol 4-phosphate cytidylyltransferase [Dehalococcoidia bacterium]
MADSRESVGAVIVAAGRGERMGGRDKLFAVVAGKSLLAHTLAAFEVCPAVDKVVLVLSVDSMERGRRLIAEGGFAKVVDLCPGGERRQDSVRNGLTALASCQWVVVHDGARPLVTAELIERGLEAAKETGAAVAAVPIRDTIKEVEPSGVIGRTLSRSQLWAAQTPQVFRYDILCEAHQRAKGEVTDDAALVEKLGYQVRVFEGSPDNIKVTTPADLALVKALLAQGRAD